MEAQRAMMEGIDCIGPLRIVGVCGAMPRAILFRFAGAFSFAHVDAMARRRRARRARERATGKMVRDLERLARLAPGGAPEHPIEVASPSLVDIRAVAVPCPLCEGALKLEEHSVIAHGGERLRVAVVYCTGCATRRQRYFRVGGPAVH